MVRWTVFSMARCARPGRRDLLRGGMLGAQTADSVGGLGLPLVLADVVVLTAVVGPPSQADWIGENGRRNSDH